MVLDAFLSNINMHYILNQEKLSACYIADDIGILINSVDWIYDDQLLSEILQLACGIQSPHSVSFKQKLQTILDFTSTIREEKSIQVVESGKMVTGGAGRIIYANRIYDITAYYYSPLPKTKSAKKPYYYSRLHKIGSEVAADGL